MHRESERRSPPAANKRYLHDFVRSYAESCPSAPALRYKGERYSYSTLVELINGLAGALPGVAAEPQARIAVLLPNCPESIISAFAAFESGCIYVPVNPLYRPRQILHVLRDCGAAVLVTTRYLFASIADMEHDLDELDAVIFTDASEIVEPVNTRCRVYDWSKLTTPGSGNMPESSPSRSISDPAVIFYTSGSTGRAKGVIISHENLVDGARIVSGYLENTRCDRLVAGLPLGFDYGFSQATTALYVGAELILTNYSLPQTLLAELIQSRATCLAGVPAMWAQLVNVQWPKEFAANLRYITNSGGRLPQSVLSALRARLPDTRIFLMYGLTEAFRSSFLDPALVDEYPDSIGRPVPGVQLHVVRPDGTLCAPDEPGELVHSGALVALGYWNDPEATAEKFRPLPASSGTDLQPELAVWTGDIAKQDRNGLLFFLERADSMLKCSGYRISPTEIEETIYESGLVKHVVAVGIPDEINGQRIGLAVVPKSAHDDTDFALRYVCARELPPYMQPAEIRVLDHLPVNANGKPNRASIEALFD